MLRDELTRVIPVIQNTFTFSVSFHAAQKLLENRGESGVYMVATAMTALLLLLGAQLKCRQCSVAYRGTWFAPVLTMMGELVGAAVSLGIAFVSNLFASVLVAVLVEALDDAWVIWWGATGLALTTIAVKFVL